MPYFKLQNVARLYMEDKGLVPRGSLTRFYSHLSVLDLVVVDDSAIKIHLLERDSRTSYGCSNHLDRDIFLL